MEEFSNEDVEKRKKAIFDSMGKRGQKRILKAGYEEWNPFDEPKDPLDIRKDVTQRTVDELIREFMQQHRDEKYSVAYAEGVQEIAISLMSKNDKYRGMFEFSLWYYELLKKEGVELE